jgi:hypothetical protein
MSNANTVRTALAQWLASKVRIDRWDADPPACLFSPASTTAHLPASTATALPFKGFEAVRSELSAMAGRADFPFVIQYRFAAQHQFDELPHGDMEATVEALQVLALMELPGRNGIRQISFENSEDFPVRVSRLGDRQNDWVIVLELNFQVNFAITEVGLPDGLGPINPDEGPPFELQRIDLRVWRSEIGEVANPDQSTIDSEIIFNA